jgi:hypothetical protein
MNRKSTLRRFAAWLLEWCRRFSPPELEAWGEAMLCELDFVEGSLPALAWAAGGAGVLMRRSLIHWVTGRSRESDELGSSQTGGPMRKITVGIAVLGVSVLGVLLFAPSFRQAVSVSANSWLWAFNRPPFSPGALRRLAARARTERDAETMAFVALQLPRGPESDQLAEEAAKLDPKLTWIYYPQAARSMWLRGYAPQAEIWVKKLLVWDSENAVPHLLDAGLEAQRISGGNPLSVSENQYSSDERWMNAMQAAFAAPKFDSYQPALLNLDRDVMERRHLTNPFFFLGTIFSPSAPDLAMLERYAFMIYGRGKECEAKGDLEGASREYWTVARFGQMVHLHGHAGFERAAGVILQREAYARLESVAARAGQSEEQGLLAYQMEVLSPRYQGLFDNGFWIDVYAWNAEAGQISLLVLFLSGILLAGWVVWLAARRIRARNTGGRFETLLRASGFAGGVGLLVSSLTLYLSYHPYAELFNRLARSNDVSDAQWLISFFGFAEVPSTLNRMFTPSFWWSALLVFAGCLLAIEVYRFFASRGPAQETI